MKSRNSASRTAWTSTEFDHLFEGSPSPGFACFDHVIEGSTDSLGHVGTGLYTSSEGPILHGVRTSGCVTGEDLGILLGQWTIDAGG